MFETHGWELIPKTSEELSEAIERAIAIEMPIAELEPLGIEERDVNALERYAHIILIADLLKWSEDDLKTIPNIGDKSSKRIVKAVKRLPKLKEIAEKYIANLIPNRKDVELIRGENCTADGKRRDLIDITQMGGKE
jgi:DNA-directed RNA polymerase alpha subunit